MHKTRLENLVAIIYRSQGLAEKIPETHQTVLANRTKPRVRSAKMARLDLFTKDLMIPGGYLESCKTHELSY
jgi:hypothetical protein